MSTARRYNTNEATKILKVSRKDLTLLTWKNYFKPTYPAGGSGWSHQYSEEDLRILNEYFKARDALRRAKSKLKEHNK